jgi:hypothetical protein
LTMFSILLWSGNETRMATQKCQCCPVIPVG